MAESNYLVQVIMKCWHQNMLATNMYVSSVLVTYHFIPQSQAMSSFANMYHQPFCFIISQAKIDFYYTQSAIFGEGNILSRSMRGDFVGVSSNTANLIEKGIRKITNLTSLIEFDHQKLPVICRVPFGAVDLVLPVMSPT